jgi:asparagine synthase (glutamine-hydrolysing)
MANSLEVRSPFLDHRLVEFTAMLPEKWKMNGFKQKVILKESVRKALPKSILNKKKTGFNAPYFKNKIKIKHSQLLADSFYLNCEKEDTTYKAFNILMLQIWLDIYENYKKTGNWTPLTYEE